MSSVHSLGIAEIKTVKGPVKLRTVLGSCIGVALFDTKCGVGGMAHVMLPEATGPTDAPGKFADTGVDELLEMLLGEGVARDRVCAKIAGGAAMFGNDQAGGIGERNAIAVVRRLESHGIGLMSRDVGGRKGRRMCLDPATGEVEVQCIGEEIRRI